MIQIKNVKKASYKPTDYLSQNSGHTRTSSNMQKFVSYDKLKGNAAQARLYDKAQRMAGQKANQIVYNLVGPGGTDQKRREHEQLVTLAESQMIA